MPILIIYGIPKGVEEQTLEIFSKLMRQRVSAVRNLEIKAEQVSIFFSQDQMSKGLGEEIIIVIEGLKEKPERTEDVKRMLIHNLIDEAHLSFPRAALIECIIHPYIMAGFGKIRRKDGVFWGDLR